VEAEDRVAPVHLPFSPAQGLCGTVAPVLAVVAETVRGWDPTPPSGPLCQVSCYSTFPPNLQKVRGFSTNPTKLLPDRVSTKDKRKLEVAGKTSQTLSLLPKSAYRRRVETAGKLS